jgi:peptidoglycan/LPS O-acetylase OafA/YrhL
VYHHTLSPVGLFDRMSSSNRLLELDVLRGVAALAVVLFHYTTRFDQIYGHSEQLWFDFPRGLYGVHLFFVISGFVIFMTLERTKASLDFVVSRFSRLYPAYWTALVLTFTIVSLATLPGRQVGVPDALMNLSMWQFLFETPHVDPVYWTLSIELSFYVLMLCLYRAGWLPKIEAVAAGWLMMMVLAVAVKNFFGVQLPDRLRILLLLEYGHLFIAGMMFYLTMKRGASVVRWLIIASCVVAQWLVGGTEVTLIIAPFFLVFALATRGYLSFLVWRPLVFLGTVSYSLYLIHQNVGYVILRALYDWSFNPNLSVAIAIVVSVGLAGAITFAVERPMLEAIRAGYASVRTKRPRAAVAREVASSTL